MKQYCPFCDGTEVDTINGQAQCAECHAHGPVPAYGGANVWLQVAKTNALLTRISDYIDNAVRDQNWSKITELQAAFSNAKANV
jgi:hypothetical protein